MVELKIEAIIEKMDLGGFEPYCVLVILAFSGHLLAGGLILFDILKYSDKRTFSNIGT